MNIQIFGTKKNNDSKKAERYFKERGIRFQYIDMAEKGLSKGEFQSVLSAVGCISALVDANAKDQETVQILSYLSADDAVQKVFENQQIMALPVVRNGKRATAGYQPDIWKSRIVGIKKRGTRRYSGADEYMRVHG